MLITNQPVPKTIEDLGQEVTDDVVLARLEQQRAVQVAFSLPLSASAAAVGFVSPAPHACSCLLHTQDEAIRSYKADTLVVGAPKPSPTASEGSEEEGELQAVAPVLCRQHHGTYDGKHALSHKHMQMRSWSQTTMMMMMMTTTRPALRRMSSSS